MRNGQVTLRQVAVPSGFTSGGTYVVKVDTSGPTPVLVLTPTHPVVLLAVGATDADVPAGTPFESLIFKKG